MMFSNRFSAGSVLVSKKIFMLVLCSLLFLQACDFDKSRDDDGEETVDSIYTDPVTIDSWLQQKASSSSRASYVRLGFSSDGEYPISKIIISDNPGVHEGEPRILVVGAMHGDEQSASYVSLKLIELLLSEDDAVQDLVEEYEIHVLPVLNPWGLENINRYTVNGVDLNRNFSWAWTSSSTHGDEAFDQSESQTVKDDGENNNYSMTISFHSGEACISTTWDYIGSESSEGIPAEYSYEDFISLYMPNGEIIFSYAQRYELDVVLEGNDSFYAIEGFDWYPCYGTLGDWFYGERGSLSYTIELSEKKVYYPGFDVSVVWEEHKKALLKLLPIASQGISGAIYDQETGDPVYAKVSISKVDRSPQDPVVYTPFGYSNGEDGYFAIICDSGSYSLTVEAEGYESYTTSLSVEDSLRLEDISLQKE